MCLTFAFPLTSHATTLSDIASEASSSEEEENSAYFSDDEFEEFFTKIQDEYNSGNTGAMRELYALITSGGLSYTQLQTVLETGYFTEYIEMFQKSGFLNEDYELPETVTPIEVDIESEEVNETAGEILWEEDPDVVYVHDLEEITTLDAQQKMVDLMNDNVRFNSYINCSVDVESKVMNSQMIEVSAFTGEPLTVNFTNTDGSIAYAWKFTSIIYTGTEDCDLTVTYTENTLDYDLGITLPRKAALYLYVGKEPGSRVNLKDSNGNIAASLVVDDDGYITMWTTGEGHYGLTYEAVTTTETESSVESLTQEQEGFLSNLPVSNLFIVFIILLLIGIGIGLLSYVFFKKISRKKSKYRKRK